MASVNVIEWIHKYAKHIGSDVLEVGAKRYKDHAYLGLREFLAEKLPRSRLIGCDISAGDGVDVVLDMTAPSQVVKSALNNKTFDAVFCVSVLEHIPDDFRALTELFRVLKPRGWAILQVPIDLSRDKTIEDTNMTMLPEERERVFGLKEHVRLYGKDYKDRLEKAGFTVKVDTYVKELGNDVIKKYGLAKNEDIYYCVKKNS